MALTPEQQAFFDNWYERTKREQLEYLRKQNETERNKQRTANEANPQDNYVPTANLSLDVASEYVTSREHTLQVHRAQLKTIPEGERERFEYILGKSAEISQQMADAQMDVWVYSAMSDQAKGAEKSFLSVVSRANDMAQRVIMRCNQTYFAFDSVFDQMMGQSRGGVTLVPADEFKNMSDEQKKQGNFASLQPGEFDSMLEDAPDSLRGMKFRDYLALPPVQTRLPDAFAMDFMENKNFNSRTFLENMTKQNKQPTVFEKDYALSIYETTFAGVYNKQQKNELASNNLNEFDLITINGRTVNEIYADKYKDLEPMQRDNMLRCEVVAAVMGSEKNVAFSRLENNEHGHPVLSQPSAITRGGELHDPKPTLGQRLLNLFGIKKYVPLSRKMAEANAPERLQEAREQMRGGIESYRENHKNEVTAEPKAIEASETKQMSFDELMAEDTKEAGIEKHAAALTTKTVEKNTPTVNQSLEKGGK